MASLLDGLAEPFARVESDDAAAALHDVWGITPRTMSRLDTERDDTFTVTSDSEHGTVVLKIAHPSDIVAQIEVQATALEWVRGVDPRIPVQRVVPTRDGSLVAAVNGRAARVLTWLPGRLMIDGPTSPALLHESGRMLGRLAVALSGLDAPAADRELAWDIARLPALRAATRDPVLLATIDDFETQVSPRLHELPRQVIHNDFHPANLLIDPDRPDSVAGVLDFGDLVVTARVCDLGVALAYLLPDDAPPALTIDTFVEGYRSTAPLLDEEVELIPRLIAARQVARLIINDSLARQQGIIRAAPRITRSLHRILDVIEKGA